MLLLSLSSLKILWRHTLIGPVYFVFAVCLWECFFSSDWSASIAHLPYLSWDDRSVLSLMLELTTAQPCLTGNHIWWRALCLLQALLPVVLSVMIARALSLGRWALIRIHPRIIQREMIWNGAREGLVHKVVAEQICEGLVQTKFTLLQCQIQLTLNRCQPRPQNPLSKSPIIVYKINNELLIKHTIITWNKQKTVGVRHSHGKMNCHCLFQ